MLIRLQRRSELLAAAAARLGAAVGSLAAHGAQEPKLLHEAADKAFEHTLNFEVIGFCRFVADFARELEHLLHVGFDHRHGFAAVEGAGLDLFDRRTLEEDLIVAGGMSLRILRSSATLSNASKASS